MSNHSSRRRINLHHQQVNDAIVRRVKKHNDRLLAFLGRRAIIWEGIMTWRMSICTIYNLCWYAIVVAIILSMGWLIL